MIGYLANKERAKAINYPAGKGGAKNTVDYQLYTIGCSCFPVN